MSAAPPAPHPAAPEAPASAPCLVHVALHTPAHIGLGDLLTYGSERALPAGTLVRVPLGSRELLGVVWDAPGGDGLAQATLPEGARLRAVAAVLDGLAPLDAHWRRLIAFAARYYQRALGELALAALPPQLRELRPEQLARRLRRPAGVSGKGMSATAATDMVTGAETGMAATTATDTATPIALSAEQADAIARIAAQPGPFLLFGSTGSGKTEVYLRCVQQALEADAGAQALVLVPEINLTPQLEERFVRRFAPRFGAAAVVCLHSGKTPAQRLANWLAAHSGAARIVLGTRMAVLASLPQLKLIVVDEEHDASYKQQEGARYSARDLAIWRGREHRARVLLGSATPSLESWHASRPRTPEDPRGGRYLRLYMPSRIGAGAGVETGAATGAGTGAVTGTQTGAVTGADTSAAAGVQAGAVTGAGAATGAQTDSVAGAQAGAATGAGTVTQTGAVASVQTETVTNTQTGAVTGADTSAAAGAEAVTGAGAVTNTQTGAGAATGTGAITAPAPNPALPANTFPRIRRVDMNLQPRNTLLSPPLLAAIGARVARGEQSMILLNRRGYAPVLHCADCGWKSDCPHCSAHQVFHKTDRSLRCHHCGACVRVPRHCPGCGSPDIAALGRGTEQLEEQLCTLLAQVLRPDGAPARIARIDADSTRARGALEAQLAQVHSGAVDVLVGTQMIAKGHDFRRITLVAAVQPDGALFSSDFRAPERLFALLLQAGGRAGRDAAYLAAQGTQCELWLQSRHPRHPVFEALRAHDYPGFAAAQLQERQAAAMPPFACQALLRADARTQQAAQDFLGAASAAAQAAVLPGQELVTLFPPVPLAIQRVANVERAQMLLESSSRSALQAFLAAWQPVLQSTRGLPAHKGLIRWLVDVDPLVI